MIILLSCLYSNRFIIYIIELVCSLPCRRLVVFHGEAQELKLVLLLLVDDLLLFLLIFESRLRGSLLVPLAIKELLVVSLPGFLLKSDLFGFPLFTLDLLVLLTPGLGTHVLDILLVLPYKTILRIDLSPLVVLFGHLAPLK